MDENTRNPVQNDSLSKRLIDNYRRGVKYIDKLNPTLLKSPNQDDISQFKNGGVSRKQAIKSKMDEGLSRKQARREYRREKKAVSKMENNDLDYDPVVNPIYARQSTQHYDAVIENPRDIVIEERSPILPDYSIDTTNPIVFDERYYDNMSFNRAFSLARKKALNGGDKTFVWRGNLYGTKIRTELNAGRELNNKNVIDSFVEDPENFS